MAAALAAEGYSVFRRDAEEAAASSNHQPADAVIVLWSDGLMASKTGLESARRALARRALVPVSLGDIEPPKSFAHLWPIDLAGWAGDVDDPRWQFVRDEISLAVRRHEMEPAPETEENSAGAGLPLSAPRLAAPQLRLSERLARLHPGDTNLSARMILPAAAGLALLTAGVLWAAMLMTGGENNGAHPVIAMLDTPEKAAQGEGEASVSAPSPGAVAQRTDRRAAAPPPDLRETTGGDADSATESLSALSEESDAPPESDPEDIGASQDNGIDIFAALDVPSGTGDDLTIEPEQDDPQTDRRPEEEADAVESGEVQEDSAPESFANAPPLPPTTEDAFSGVIFRDCFECPDMAEIPAGAVEIDFADPDAARVSAVSRPYALSRREVTFEEWNACVEAGACRAYRPADAGWGRDKRPVINVSWEDAQSYVGWLISMTGRAYRLPTEAEWEFAAYAGGGALEQLTPMRANYNAGPGGARGKTTPTASFNPSVFGLFDLFGNVKEWTADCWTGGEGSAACGVRVVKGGAYDSQPDNLSPWAREAKPQQERSLDTGFRVARNLP